MYMYIYVYTHVFSFILFFIICYYEILSIVPYSVQ